VVEPNAQSFQPRSPRRYRTSRWAWPTIGIESGIELSGFAPVAGRPTCTAFGTMSPAVTFNYDVYGIPVASPGRTDRNPFPVGFTTVTFNNTPVARAVTLAPVTCSM
jgi:hypothetical protein